MHTNLGRLLNAWNTSAIPHAMWPRVRRWVRTMLAPVADAPVGSELKKQRSSLDLGLGVLRGVSLLALPRSRRYGAQWFTTPCLSAQAILGGARLPRWVEVDSPGQRPSGRQLRARLLAPRGPHLRRNQTRQSAWLHGTQACDNACDKGRGDRARAVAHAWLKGTGASSPFGLNNAVELECRAGFAAKKRGVVTRHVVTLTTPGSSFKAQNEGFRPQTPRSDPREASAIDPTPRVEFL